MVPRCPPHHYFHTVIPLNVILRLHYLRLMSVFAFLPGTYTFKVRQTQEFAPTQIVPLGLVKWLALYLFLLWQTVYIILFVLDYDWSFHFDQLYLACQNRYQIPIVPNVLCTYFWRQVFFILLYHFSILMTYFGVPLINRVSQFCGHILIYPCGKYININELYRFAIWLRQISSPSVIRQTTIATHESIK